MRLGSMPSEKISDPARLEDDANEPAEAEHDRNANVLYLLDGEWISCFCSESLHPHVGRAVEEADEGFHPFRRDGVALP